MRRFPPKGGMDQAWDGTCKEPIPSMDERKTVFFFIAGIQPKTVELEDHPRRCSSCGLYQGRLKRVDHYLSLFFIPVFRVKRGESFVQCQSCGKLSGESGEDTWHRPETPPETRCLQCGAVLEPAFRFCPKCGREIL